MRRALLLLTLVVVANGVYGDGARRQREDYGLRLARLGDRNRGPANRHAVVDLYQKFFRALRLICNLIARSCRLAASRPK